MKLRNKKTGEIVDDVQYRNYSFTDGFGLRTENKDYEYKTLAEFVEEWEDYKPIEPLIDLYDDRRMVRHWADVYNIKEVWVHGIGDGKEVVEIYDVENGLMRMTFYRPKKMEIDKAYTIAELCGEDEEG